MKLLLGEALHARPANLFVRVASQFTADVVLRKGERHANGKSILDVLSLGAAKGDVIEIEAAGDDAERAEKALRELVETGFDADLVPEAGMPAVEGIGIGEALVFVVEEPAERARGSDDEERARAVVALGRVERDVAALVKALPPDEAELFVPEIEILRALHPDILGRIAYGHSAEDAVRDATSVGSHDLLVDARARLLHALGGGASAALAMALASRGEAEIVLVTESLVPSIVALLPPQVVAIIASDSEGHGYTSHAAILARGRDIPLVFVHGHVAASIVDRDLVVVDSTASPARLWVGPSSTLLGEARSRRDARARARTEGTQAASLEHLAVAVRANVGSFHDVVPSGAEGIGLVRTELLFAERAVAPSETEQFAILVAIASKARGGPVVARLFDAGGDKPLPWLGGRHASRGIELLTAFPEILSAQLRAMERARERADVRVLLPLVRSEADVERVRALCRTNLPLGAMIETPEAVLRADAIAAAADFLCVGTNDLAALALGIDRAVASLSLDPRVLQLVQRIVEAAHARGRSVTVCGEIAADPIGARVLVGLGVDAISVVPARVVVVRSALAATTLAECRALAVERLGG